MGKFDIQVEPADQPEHIQWHNFQTQWYRLLCGKLLTIFAYFVLVAI